jgi:hypothetical protein
MNWYKIAVPIIEREDFEETGKQFPRYTDIGHETFNVGKPSPGCKEFIWTWKEGNLEVFPAKYTGTPDNMHKKIWGKNVVMFYRGRAKICGDKAAVSIVVPPTLSAFREVPNTLVSQLYSKFTPNAKLYVFRPQGFDS